MKKLICAAMLLGVSVAMLAANDYSQLQQYLDPDTTLEDIVRRLENPEYDPAAENRLLLLDGTIASITIQEDSAEYFEAVVELAAGSWSDEETIELYRSYVVFPGIEFAPFFAGNDERLEVGSRILTIVQPLGVIADPVTGDEVLFLEAWYLRSLP